MPYWPPDSAPAEPEQMPAAPNSGPAPVPYGGPGFAIAPDMLAPVPVVAPGVGAGAGVLVGVTGANDVSEAPLAAPNVNPYDAGGISEIYTGGDDNPAGLDDVAGSVAASVAAAEARFGTIIGDLMTFPGTTATGAPLDPGAAAGVTEPGGGFYEPPRNY